MNTSLRILILRIGLLLGAMTAALGADAQSPFAGLDRMPHVSSTYLSGRLLPEGQRDLLQSQAFGTLFFEEEFESMQRYTCSSEKSVRRALESLDEFLKTHPDTRMLGRKAAGAQYTELYALPYGKGSDQYETLVIFGYYAPNSASISVVEWNHEGTKPTGTQARTDHTLGLPGSVTAKEIPAIDNDGAGKLTYTFDKAFTSFLNYSAFNVQVVKSSFNMLAIEGDFKKTPPFKVETSGGALTLSDTKGKTGRGCRITLYCTGLDEIQNFNSGDITVVSLTPSPQMLFRAYGSGDIRVTTPIDCEHITLTTLGGGDIDMTETVNSRDFEASSNGSGSVKAINVASVQAALTVNGSGSVTVNRILTDSLYMVNAGSGDIKVSGNATDTTAVVNGSGDINARGLKTQRLEKVRSGSGDICMKDL